MQKTIYTALIILSIINIGWCIYRDIQIEKQYTGDLRNRIVGARLQKDGIPPYFHKWEKGDGLRYYDPQNFDTLKVSNITATPFLHQLFYPLADLPQRKISKIWLGIEYLVLLAAVIIFFSFAKNNKRKIAIVLVTALFLYTSAWTNSIAAGQIYLLIPFFALLFYYCIVRKEKIIFAAFAGINAAILLLIRPTAIFFLLPFLFIIKQYNRKYLLFLFTSMIFIFILAFGSSHNRTYWLDYTGAIQEQLKSHQSTGAITQQNEPDPGYQNWEGWDSKETAKEYSAFPYDYSKEHGNIFVLVNHAFQTKIPVWLLAITSVIIMLVITFLFYKPDTQCGYNLYQVSIFAFCLYMVTDFFSPIHRFLYNGIQWLFPLLLIASGYNKKYLWIYAGITTGLLLNSISLSFISMENTLGEYIIFLFLLIFLFKYKPEPAV